MTYDPNIHHRRSIRLKGYDYSQEGMYFVTICVQNRDHLFGEIVGADLRVRPNNINENDQGEHIDSPIQMILNDAGKMVEKWFHELENKFPDIECGEFVVMPNHFHCIIINTGHVVRADLRVRPKTPDQSNIIESNIIESNIMETNMMENNIMENNIMESNIMESNIMETNMGDFLGGEHIGSPLHQIVQWFKTMTTNEYIRGVKTLGWKRFDGKLWQRNYWEHIIWDDQSYEDISKYIINNPKNWHTDKLK